jgi:hypothetical protein
LRIIEVIKERENYIEKGIDKRTTLRYNYICVTVRDVNFILVEVRFKAEEKYSRG